MVEQFLELHRRPISERRMQPLAIVNVFDEEGKPVLDIVHRPVIPEVDLLGLQGLEEALGGRVVIGVAFPGHADPEAVMKERVHVVVGGILDPPIGVMNDSCRGIALSKGHPKGFQAQGRVDVARKRLADGPACEEVQDDRQVHEAALDADVGDIGHPDLIGSRNQQVLHEVGINPMRVVAVCGANPSALGLAR